MRRPAALALLVAELTALGVVAAGMVATGGAAEQRSVAQSVPLRVDPGQACTDVLLLAARGSHEDAPAPAGQQFGATLDGFRGPFAAAVAGLDRTLEQRALELDAPRVRTLRADGTKPGTPARKAVRPALVRAWSAGVPGGVDAAVQALQAAAEACPDQQVVLAGYGQGAMVMHRALLALEDRPDITERVAGVALVADGDRRSVDSTARLMGAPAARGGSGVAAQLTEPVDSIPVAGSLVAVWDVCTRGDLVCDLRDNGVRQAIVTHRSYRSGDGLAKVQRLGTRIGNRVGRWPLPPRTPERVAGTVGLQVDHQLAVRVRESERDQVAWQDAQGLPPGVTLTEDGRLTGVPTQGGTYSVTFTVHSTAGPAFGHRTVGSAEITVVETAAASITAGGTQTCRTTAEGAAYCWGRNNWGQFGNGTIDGSRVPVEAGSRDGWTELSTSGSTTCGIQEDGSLWCWGLNQYGQLGDGTRTTRKVPVRVGSATSWESVSTGWAHTCAVRTNGTLWCWGYNKVGQIGDGTTTTRVNPKRVGDARNWRSVSTGGWFTCGVRDDGSAWCWGANAFGQLGNGQVRGSQVPMQVGFTSEWAAVSASWYTACGLKNDGELRCWGLNDRGQIGDGTRQNRRYPALVLGGQRYRSVSVGDAHVCAIAQDASLQCWGDNVYGQLGAGSVKQVSQPVTNSAGEGWYSVDAGWLHTCGLKQDGTTWCWGNSEYGQVGDGAVKDRRTAVPVS